MKLLQDIFLAVMGYSTGLIVAGGVFAFIAVIGVIPRFAQRTRTIRYLRWYEDVIVMGGVFGCLNIYLNYSFHTHHILVSVIALSTGIFFGALSVSLAEVLNVMPVFMRRVRLTKGLPFFLLALSLGKTVGSLLYFYLPNFK